MQGEVIFIYQIQTYFNNSLLPATPRHYERFGHLPADRFDDMIEGGYRETDQLVESEVVIYHGSGTFEGAARHAWNVLNADERPNGPRERSLCVGDVLCVTNLGGEAMWFVVKGVGFETIPEPPQEGIERFEGEAVVA
jgi:hypothetical protein